MRFFKYGEYDYPVWADLGGICLTLVIILQIPGWAIYAIWKQKKGQTLKEVIGLKTFGTLLCFSFH